MSRHIDDLSEHLSRMAHILSDCDGISLMADEEVFFKFVPKEMFELKNRTLSIKAESKLTEANGLVGLSGAYFNPKLLSASSAEEVFEAWTWINDRVGEDFRQMSLWISADFVMKVVSGREMNFQLTAPMGIAVVFHKLSKLTNAEIKLKELKRFLRGNARYWAQRELSKIAAGADQMIRYLSNIESEIEFSIFAINCELPVELTAKPDMYLDKIPVDVKSLSWNPSLSVENYVRKVIDRANKAFRQKAKLAALSIGSALTLLGLQTKVSGDFCHQLVKGLKLATNNRKPTLLFYHIPWTQNVIAETQTLTDLQEILAWRRNMRILQTIHKLPEPEVVIEGRQKHFKFKIK